MKRKETMSENESRLDWKVAQLDVKFIDLKRDFAFKWMFGTEGHEELLLMLVDSLLPEKHIRSVKLGAQEQEPDREDAQGGIYDIYCETGDGSSLTIEMQVCPQKDFNDRMVFYSSFPIRNRVGQGAAKDYTFPVKDVRLKERQLSYVRYKLPPIYVIGILDFELHGIGRSPKTIRHFSIREDDDGNGLFTDSIHFVTVELPKFRKAPSSLETRQDFMLFAIKNSGTMKEVPKEFSGKGFDKFFEMCSFAGMSEDMQMKYVRRMMAEWDREGQLATAIMDGEARGLANGRAEGLAEGRREIVRKMKAMGMEPDVISQVSGLTIEQVSEM